MSDYNIRFTYNSPILGVDEKYIHVKGSEMNYDEEIECIISVEKDTYHRLFQLFLRDKQDYCERFGHWCGFHYGYQIKGKVNGKGWVQNEDFDLDDESTHKKTVKCYHVVEYCKESSGMEHG